MGALVGLILIIAALIYVPYKLWSEATRDHKDLAKAWIIILAIIFLCMIIYYWVVSALTPLLYDTFGDFGILILIIPLLILLTVLVVKVSIDIEKDDSPEGIRKQIEERERFNATRTEGFYTTLREHGFNISKVAAEVLA